MVRLSWLDATLIAGGVVITAVAVATVVKAKPREEKEEEIEVPPVAPGLPAAIEFSVYPTSLRQLYGFYYTMESPVHPQILRFMPLTSFKGPPYPAGIVTERAVIRVVDAAGRGVPNVAILIWSVPTRDDQSGQLAINNALRSEVEALRLLTDSNGEIAILLHYELRDVKVLEDKHDFGCCYALGRTVDIDVGQGCGPVPAFWICCRHRDARTDVKAYTVNARIEGTVRANLFVVSCQAEGKALW